MGTVWLDSTWSGTFAMHDLCNVGVLDIGQLGASAANFEVHPADEGHTMPGWIKSQLGGQNLNMVLSGPAGFGKTWFLNEKIMPSLHER